MMELRHTSSTLLYMTLTFLLQVEFGLVIDPPTFKPKDRKSFHDSSRSGLGYYRQLVIDQDTHYLYVGAMERLYRLSADDITRSFTKSEEVAAFDRDVNNCKIRGKEENGYECKNHIRTIVVNEDKIYTCGTCSFNPVEYEFSKTDLRLLSQPKSRSGQGQCPLDPDDTFACVYVRNGNPGNVSALYTGTFRDINRDDPLVHRGQLMKNNVKYSELLRSARSGWLQEGATFVSGFETRDHVYFFFRETAEEFYNDDKTLVSRVARVCKNDRGTNSVLKNKWTTFLKARLSCSIPGDKPFYFNEIQDVKKLADNRFVGLFTTDNNGLFGAALCTFTLEETNQVFAGDFWEYVNNAWTVVKPDTVPDPHPGTCISDSQTLSLADQHFIERHPFMSEAVNAEERAPLYYQAGVIFTRMVVDQVTTKQAYTVYFLATDKGHIYKVAEYVENNERRSRVVAIWKPFDNEETRIWSMTLFNGPQYPDMEDRNDFLYLGTDSEVVQLRKTQCDSYKLCTSCVQDPYCGWNSGRHLCEKYAPGLVQGLSEPAIKVCSDQRSCFIAKPDFEVRVMGDPVHLECASWCQSDTPVQWNSPNGPVQQDGMKYISTADNGLVILNVTKADEGFYSCLSNNTYYHTTYKVVLPECTDAECVWQEEFRSWCNEFDRYRKEFNNWLCVKNSYLYLGTDSEVVQLRVTQCNSYKLCTSCVQDPYCGWSQENDRCEMYSPGLPQGLQGSSIEVCNDVGSCFRGWESYNVRVAGDPVYLKCETMCEPRQPVQWWYRNKPIHSHERKYIFTEDHGMVILNATKSDEGSYLCVSDGKYWLAAYDVRIPDCTDPDCVWQEEFRKWCGAFDQYREEFNNWLCVKEECFSNNNCQPNAIPQCHAP